MDARGLAIRLFQELQAQATYFVHRPVTRCAVTTNSTWTDEQKTVLRQCLKAAGFDHCTTLEDHEAALLGCYIKTINPDSVKRRIVVDIGLTGTRTTFFHCENGLADVLRSLQYPEGGSTIDGLMFDHCAAEFKRQHGVALPHDRETKFRILLECEKAKCLLSTAKSVTVSVKQVLDGKDLNVMIIRADFQEQHVRPCGGEFSH